jgi:hypothetical protein
MFSLSELSNRIAAYKDGRLPFSEFENWFEDNSAGAYDVPELKAACIAVDAALAEYHFDDVCEDRLKEQLGNSVRPFVAYSAEPWTPQLVSTPIVWNYVVAPANSMFVSIGANSNANVAPIPAQTAGSNSAWSDPIPAAAA